MASKRVPEAPSQERPAKASRREATLTRAVGEKLLGLGRAAQALLCGQAKLDPGKTLETAGLATGSEMQAAVGEGKPQLFLFGACSARQLAARRGDWSDELELRESERHRGMAEAPTIAREIAEAMPSLEHVPLVPSSESDDGGEVFVIANPGDDPAAACWQALAIRRVASWNDDFVDDQESEDEEEEEAEGGQKRAKSPSQKHEEQTSHAPGCTHVKLRHLTFKKQPQSENPDDQDGFLEPRGEPAWRQAQGLMAERLTRHFSFTFEELTVVCGPMIWGGYASDGSIVGVLSSRVWT